MLRVPVVSLRSLIELDSSVMEEETGGQQQHGNNPYARVFLIRKVRECRGLRDSLSRSIRRNSLPAKALSRSSRKLSAREASEW